MLECLKGWHLRLTRGQLSNVYPPLSKLLREVHKASTSNPGIERHNETKKPVLTSQMLRLGRSDVERLVPETYNEALLQMEFFKWGLEFESIMGNDSLNDHRDVGNRPILDSFVAPERDREADMGDEEIVQIKAAIALAGGSRMPEIVIR